MRSEGKAFTITHSEFFTSLTADTSDVITNYLINPGNVLLFPWLSQVAPAWERYRFQKLSIEYVPSCSTATAGDVAMFVDFDPEDPVAADFTEFAQNYNCAHTSMYVPAVLDVKTADMDRQNRGVFYTTDVAVGVDDYEHYFPGRLETFTSTLGASTVVGKLWVHYKIDLYNPQGRAVEAPGYLKNTAINNIAIGDNILIESDNDYIYSKAFAWTTAGLTCMRSGKYFVTIADVQTSVITFSGCTQQSLLGASPDKYMRIWQIDAVRGEVLVAKSDELFAQTNWLKLWIGSSTVMPAFTLPEKKKTPKFVDNDLSDMMDEKPEIRVRYSKSPSRK
jgi:hypothetical protein